LRKIGVFIHITLDGFFAGPNDEIDWFKVINKDAEWEKHTRQESQSGSTLLLGKTTYQMMKSFWPSPAVVQSDPHMAKVMNESPKIVISKTIKSVEDEQNWKNVRILRDLNHDTITKLKEEDSSGTITILGSGSIVQQLANMDFVDEYELVVVPIIIGDGKYLFKDVNMTEMKLLETRAFKNGLVSLRYQPAKQGKNE
jgi:dihydrofolate reductase